MIAIKDMEMPKNCLDCPISHEDKIDYYICGETGKNVYLYTNEIHHDCPLIEIVTCKDYTHRIGCKCESLNLIVGNNGYCSNGERRE